MIRPTPRSTHDPDASRSRTNWGDGTTSAGTITNNNNGTWTVAGSHTYTGDTLLPGNESEGSATITVTISHDASTPQVVTDTVNISDPNVVATGGFVFNLTEAAPLTNVTVATFI